MNRSEYHTKITMANYTEYKINRTVYKTNHNEYHKNIHTEYHTKLTILNSQLTIPNTHVLKEHIPLILKCRIIEQVMNHIIKSSSHFKQFHMKATVN